MLDSRSLPTNPRSALALHIGLLTRPVIRHHFPRKCHLLGTSTVPNRVRLAGVSNHTGKSYRLDETTGRNYHAREADLARCSNTVSGKTNPLHTRMKCMYSRQSYTITDAATDICTLRRNHLKCRPNHNQLSLTHFQICWTRICQINQRLSLHSRGHLTPRGIALYIFKHKILEISIITCLRTAQMKVSHRLFAYPPTLRLTPVHHIFRLMIPSGIQQRLFLHIYLQFTRTSPLNQCPW